LREIGLAEIPFVGAGVEEMPFGFGAAMDGEVFDSGDGLEVLRVVPLKTFDELHGEAAGEIGVFAIGLLAAAPAGIAKDIDIGRPEGQALVDQSFSFTDEFVVFGAGFVGDGGCHAVLHVLIPSRGEADRLWEYSCRPGAGHAVEALVPPVVFGDTEPGDGRGGVHHLANLFFESHAANEVVHPLVEG